MSTAITTVQLDELERFAGFEQKNGWPKCAVDFDVTLRLVAIARAALAWRDAKEYSERHDGDVAWDRLNRAENELRAATTGSP